MSVTPPTHVTTPPTPPSPPDGPSAPAPSVPATVPAARAEGTSSPGRVALTVLGICLAGMLALIAVGVVVLLLGPAALLIGGVLALVPLSIVVAGTLWVDRWDPEPRWSLAFCALWGGGFAVLAALAVSWTVDALVWASAGLDPATQDIVDSVVQAPIVEEVGKGLALLVVFFAARKHFDGPVDGIVYAAWTAAGFAFTENILYLGSELVAAGSSGGLIATFVVRGLMSPFAHAMFTACTGVALGFAAHRGVGRLGAVGFWLLGLVPAIGLHALWNGALYVTTDFFLYYFIVQFPLFIAVVVVVVLLRRAERRVIRARLEDYVASGWFHPADVEAVATPAGRARARSWASQSGKRAEMARYIRDTTRLAFTRQRIVAGRRPIAAQHEERELLERIMATRAVLNA